MAKSPHPNVTIDGNGLSSTEQKTYERRTEGVYNTIKLNPVGRFLIQEMSKKLTIRPYTGKGKNATASPTSFRKATPRGHRRYSCRDASPLHAANGNPRRGVGGGSNVIIEFSPTQWMTSGVATNQGKKIKPGARRDEILFHEMVHAMRQMAGQLNCSDAASGYDTKAEVWSIITTNIYSSCWNRPLRKDHHGFHQLGTASAKNFYKGFERMIGHMCRDFPRFTRNVAGVHTATFNPFREYYRHHANA